MLSVQMTMFEALRGVAESHLGREALVCDDVRLTYRELLAGVSALSEGLIMLGL